jgi:hypothetical protein
MKMCVQNIFIALAMLAGVHQAGAVILLSDNFDDNSIDTGKWATNTTLSDGLGTPRVIEQNQRLEITARGYFNTATNYDPSSPGGLLITGTWTFLNYSGGNSDTPTVVTRSSGTPTPFNVASGEPTAGINFRLSVPAPDQFYIYGSGDANVTSLNVISNTLNLAQGDTVNFSVMDDGTNLSFYLTKVGDPSQAASCTAVCTNHLAANKISFYNREYNADSLALDDVVIQARRPQLTIATAGNQEVLFWPASATNYILQSTTNLSSTNWITASDAVPVLAVTVTNQSPARFFRLTPP